MWTFSCTPWVVLGWWFRVRLGDPSGSGPPCLKDMIEPAWLEGRGLGIHAPSSPLQFWWPLHGAACTDVCVCQCNSKALVFGRNRCCVWMQYYNFVGGCTSIALCVDAVVQFCSWMQCMHLLLCVWTTEARQKLHTAVPLRHRDWRFQLLLLRMLSFQRRIELGLSVGRTVGGSPVLKKAVTSR
jgi:hypothetical protein